MTLAAAARWLSLAAAPVFALMAAVTAAQESRVGAMVCGVVPMSPLGGMAVMYALMAAFHVAPWLRLVADRRASPH